MPTPQLEYLGFKSGEATRDYRMLVRNPDGTSAEFTIVIDQKAFLAHRVRYQDGAEICYWKLQRELTAWGLAPDGGPPASRQSVTDADLLEFKDAHQPKPRRLAPPVRPTDVKATN
jgi:hypothetical protein